MSYTTKAHAHPLTISAPSCLLQYSRTNNDSHIPPLPLNSESVADARRGKRHASTALSSISATGTGPSSPATTLHHSASPIVSVLSSASQPISPFASERASSSRTTPSSSLPQSSSFATASAYKAILVISMQRSSPGGTGLADPPTSLFCNSREESAEPEPQYLVSDRRSNTLAPGPSMKYLQALSIMIPIFSSAMSQTKLSKVIRTRDLLVRDNAVSFLRD
jgi:hypothetical protein